MQVPRSAFGLFELEFLEVRLESWFTPAPNDLLAWEIREPLPKSLVAQEMFKAIYMLRFALGMYFCHIVCGKC